MIANYTHAMVLRLEERYAVLRLNTGEELPALYSSLPGEPQPGMLLCRYDNHWVSEQAMQRKRNRQLRSLRSLLKGK